MKMVLVILAAMVMVVALSGSVWANDPRSDTQGATQGVTQGVTNDINNGCGTRSYSPPKQTSLDKAKKELEAAIIDEGAAADLKKKKDSLKSNFAD